MIIVKLIGGLGNQMFQYAAGRAASLRAKTTLKLDISGFEFQNRLDTPRSYELDIFKLKADFATNEEINKLKQNRGSFIERVMRNRVPKVSQYILKSRTYYYENVYHQFEDRILHLQGDAYLEGWWQSDKYFRDVKDIIQKDFEFSQKPDTQNRKILKRIQESNSVSIHIRRGDYIKIKNYNSYYIHLGLDYYTEAIGLIAKKMTKPSLYIFTDDPEWARGNVKLPYPVTVVSHNLGKNNHEDLRLMSACQCNIIANSAFSWWAAYLNRNPRKIVVAPKKWLVSQQFSIEDRVPAEWLKI